MRCGRADRWSRPSTPAGRRARRTILAADAVNLLAAAVLYILAASNVRGFAFTLGVTTLIDLVVVFLFTHPLVSILAHTEFFGGGHRWSGLDPERLGAKSRYAGAGRFASPVRRGQGGQGMVNFAQFGNDLYTGKRSIDFIGRQKALVLHLGASSSRWPSSGSSPGASTSVSSSGAVRSSGSPASRTPATTKTRPRARLPKLASAATFWPASSAAARFAFRPRPRASVTRPPRSPWPRRSGSSRRRCRRH